MIKETANWWQGSNRKGSESEWCRVAGSPENGKRAGMGHTSSTGQDGKTTEAWRQLPVWYEITAQIWMSKKELKKKKKQPTLTNTQIHIGMREISLFSSIWRSWTLIQRGISSAQLVNSSGLWKNNRKNKKLKMQMLRDIYIEYLLTITHLRTSIIRLKYRVKRKMQYLPLWVHNFAVAQSLRLNKKIPWDQRREWNKGISFWIYLWHQNYSK